MNYYQARQRQTDKRWDYTCRNGEHIFPVGYCQAWRDFDPPYNQGEQYERYLANKEKYHTGGHDSAEDAERCYYTYLHENRMRTVAMGTTQVRCDYPDCQTWTSEGISVEYALAMLCSAHRNKEGWMKVHPFRPGISSISS